MKTLKIITIAIIIVLCGCVIAANAESATYTKIAVVTAWEQVGDTALKVITVTDEDGNLWDFFDDEVYWTIGDVTVITLCQDEVMDVVKIDHLEWHEIFNWLDKIYG